MSGGPLSINLRDKFKLLRQWQMQQQEDFLRKQIEYKQQTLQNEEKINPLSSREIDVESEDKNEESSVYDEEQEFDVGRNGRSGNQENSLGFMQRMSPGSLQRALSGALEDIEVDGAEKTAAADLEDQTGAFQDIESAEEYSDVDTGDDYETSDANLWDKSTEMQTVVFKPTQSSDDKVVTEDVMSSASSFAGSLNELEGVYPIVYSEDVSENEDKEEEGQSLSIETHNVPLASDIINDDVPFDERPAKSKIGNEITSFEQLIEKQLQIEQETNKKTQISQKQDKSRKSFLRKGDGISRFGKNSKVGSSSVRKVPEKSNTLSNAAKGLPKTSLKLVSDVKPRGYPISAVHAKQNIPRACERSMVEEEVEMLSHPTTMSSALNEQAISRDATRKEFSTHASPDSSIEASFQKMLLKSNGREKIDDEELEEFELLEEAAVDTSLSSNASVVVRMMSKASSSVHTRAHNVTSSPLQKAIYQTKRERKTPSPSYESHSLSVNIEDSEEEDDVENYLANDIPDLMKSRMPNSNDLSDIKENDEHDMTSVEFHDQSVWADTTQSTDDFESTITESPNAKPNKNLSPWQESPPPTSNLMKQFFPNLQKEKRKPLEKEIIKETNDREEMKNMKNDNKRSTVVNSIEEISTGNASDILKIKLKELEDEIKKFKQENSNLERLKIEREKELSNLRAEVERFQRQRSEELERIEKFKDEEMRKIKRERKLFEKYQKEARTIPNKKDREEIESLKQQIEDLQDELKRRETRWNGSAARFRKRIEDVENENYELKENLKLLERERLQRWSKREQMSDDSDQKSKHTADQTTRSIKDDIQKPNFSNSNGETSPHQIPVKNQRNITKSPREHRHLTYNEEIVKEPPRKLELNPRSDVVPQEQPPTPRKNYGSKNASSVEKSTQRLSLTPEKHGTTKETTDPEMRYSDGKVERILSNGSREITFPNGTRKTIDPTNQSVVISFFNGDMKQILADERVVYYYAESKTTHTTCKDGLEIFEFSNRQIEKHYPNGRKEIIYPDKTVKCIFVNGAEETVFADGTIQNLDVNGERTISFPNGQREIHTQHYKRREYPDGTMKTVHQDGRQETRYASGRLRIKDPNGNVIVDTGIA